MSIHTINPATEKVLAHYTNMSQDDINTIIQSLHEAQPVWARCALDFKKQCLLNLEHLLLQNKMVYATQITNEMGKPLTQSLQEIEKCARICRFYYEKSEAFLQPTLIQTHYAKSYRSIQPLGTIFAIMPFNFPFGQVFRFAIPNLMLGNTCLLKHDPKVTGCARMIEQLCMQAGFGPDVFKSITIDEALAPFVIHHPLIAGVTLTGSVRAGKSVARVAGEALKKVVLELGGNDPYIILEDADLEWAAEQCVISRLSNAGQICIAAKRIIVVDAVKERFEALIVEKARAYHMGDPLDLNTLLGPMARSDLRAHLHQQVQSTIESGARCLLGGCIPKGMGYYYPATVLTDVTTDSVAFNEELFGPVVCLYPAKNEEHAIKLANTSDFGLGCAIFTKNIDKGEYLAREVLQAGTSAVNTFVASCPDLPFGGIKQSGFGRELSCEGMHEFANIKTVVISTPSSSG